jgi:hypothetical protein
MSHKSTLSSNRRRRKLFTFIWIAALCLITIIMIYREMTALLYIFATLAVTVLLVIVALADLSHAEKTTPDVS